MDNEWGKIKEEIGMNRKSRVGWKEREKRGERSLIVKETAKTEIETRSVHDALRNGILTSLRTWYLPASSCEDGWLEFRGSCYYVSNGNSLGLRFEYAESSCNRKSSSLAVITSDEEAAWLGTVTWVDSSNNLTVQSAEMVEYNDALYFTFTATTCTKETFGLDTTCMPMVNGDGKAPSKATTPTSMMATQSILTAQGHRWKAGGRTGTVISYFHTSARRRRVSSGPSYQPHDISWRSQTDIRCSLWWVTRYIARFRCLAAKLPGKRWRADNVHLQ